MLFPTLFLPFFTNKQEATKLCVLVTGLFFVVNVAEYLEASLSL